MCAAVRSRQRYRRQAVVSLFAILLAWGPTSADPLPQAPANAEAMLRVLATEDKLTVTERERLMKHPLLRFVRELPMETVPDFDFGEVLDQVEGTALFSVLSRPDGSSSLATFFADQALREQRAQVVQELNSLALDLDYHRMDTEDGKYPTDIEKYFDEVRYYRPNFPDGVTLEYRPAANRETIRLSVRYGDETELGKLGPPPVLDGLRGSQHSEPTRPQEPLNFVLGIKVVDPQKAQVVSNKLLGPSQRGFWRMTADDGTELVATLRGHWWVASDRQGNLGEFFETLNGRKPGLASRSSYQTVARNVAADSPVFFFLDTQSVARSKALPREFRDPMALRFLDLVGPMGYALVAYPESQYRIEAFFGIHAQADSPLGELLGMTRGMNPEAAMDVSNVPWDVSNLFALDYRAGKALLDATVALVPEAVLPYEVGQDILAGFLGLDAQKGFGDLIDGPVLVNFERIDLLINLLEETFSTTSYSYPEAPDDYGQVDYEELEEQIRQIEEEQAQREEEDEENPDPTDDVENFDEVDVTIIVDESDEETFETYEEDDIYEPSEPREPKFPRVPFTVAAQVADGEQQARLIKILDDLIGEEGETVQRAGVQVRRRTDGLLSYALLNDWLYISGGQTERLMDAMLETAQGKRESLSSLKSWSEFRTGQRGRLLGYSHQKVDAFFSVVKGFLLFLGPEFRPIANELGLLRDSQASMTIVPDGFLVVGEVLQGDGR